MSLDVKNHSTPYQSLTPNQANRYSFRSGGGSADYKTWPKLSELCVTASNGLMEKRGGALMDIDRAKLESRMRSYYDSGVSWETLASLGTGLTRDAAGFDAKKIREKVQKAESFQPDHLKRYALRPTVSAMISPVYRCLPRMKP